MPFVTMPPSSPDTEPETGIPCASGRCAMIVREWAISKYTILDTENLIGRNSTNNPCSASRQGHSKHWRLLGSERIRTCGIWKEETKETRRPDPRLRPFGAMVVAAVADVGWDGGAGVHQKIDSRAVGGTVCVSRRERERLRRDGSDSGSAGS